jgi:hypothetical protein
MTRSEIALLLGMAAARDLRTIGEADVLAWHEDLGDLDFDDARAGLRRYFREHTERIMPAHVRRYVRIIRSETGANSVVRALPPGKLEDDPERAERIARNRAKVQAVINDFLAGKSVADLDDTPLDGSELIRQRALDRAREAKRGLRVA